MQRTRTRRRRGAAFGLAVAALAATPAARAEITSPLIGGLPWRSGATDGGFNCLADLRNRPLDALNVYLAPATFPDMVRNSGAWVQRYGAKAPLLVVSMALVPQANKGQFAQCGNGTFDSYFRQVGANLSKSPAKSVVVRLGWEANIGSHSHPWGVDSDKEVPAYRACWRRAAQALKAGGSRLNIEWTNSKKTSNGSLHVMTMYPGDDVVDLWGVHYYDAWPLKNTQTIWNQYYDITYNGAPWGIGAWMAEARKHKKKLGIGEWGIKRLSGQSASQADDPVYIDNMYKFFKSNAGDIAYETYFDGNTGEGDSALCPSNLFPKAASTYRLDWGLGK
jgi:hypothetical protein